jgi:hypothetical protein
VSSPVVLDDTHAVAAGSTLGEGLFFFTLGQAPQVLPPPSGFAVNDVAVSPDQTTVIVAMTNQTTIKTDLFVTTDLVNYAPLTTNGSRSPTF